MNGSECASRWVMLKKLSFFLWVLVSLLGNVEGYIQRFGSQELNTFYKYDAEDLEGVKEVEFGKEGSKAQVKKWAVLFNQLAEKFSQECNSVSLVYLLSAQRDVALLSLQSHQKIVDLDPISSKLGLLFFPEYQQNEGSYDPLSEKITQIVYEKYEKRFKREQRQAKTYSDHDSPFREGVYPKKELRLERCIPWLVGHICKFRAPPPPDQNDAVFWNTQIQFSLDIQKSLGEEQIGHAKKWAGSMNPGVISPNDWALIGLQAIYEADQPLDKMLFMGSVYTQGLFDVAIAVFDSKYTYKIKRPSILDRGVREHILNPVTPSYPSGHAANAAAAAILLSYFFPESTQKWNALAVETSLSRVWGGVHTTFDVNQGIILGSNVIRAFLDKIYTFNE